MQYLIKVFSSLAKIKLVSWVFILGLIGASFLVSKMIRKNKKMDTRKLTIGSLCIALSFIISYIRLYHLPAGGSITPGSMLPIMLFAFIFGPVDGILAGMVYGLLEFIQEPYIVHWAQVLLDYPLAFGALGIAGYFKKNFRLAMIAGGFGRFFFSFLSGILFYAADAQAAGMNAILYSIFYNGSYIGGEIIICIVISMVPQFKNALNKIKSDYSQI